MKRSGYFILFAFAALVTLLVSCSKVTAENYDKIETGMTLSQVEAILGKGTEQSGAGISIGDLGASAKVIKWGDDKKSITITFANDKVMMKARTNL